jgi:acetolactate synthase-1/2/3 large subunit
VFGVPGTQSIDVWEGLRRRDTPRAVVATNELAASFMANGYARATGRVGVVLTIPGPGFTYALTGLAEARLDSTPLVHIVGAPAVRADGGFALQAIEQVGIAAPLAKAVVGTSNAAGIDDALERAFALAAGGEPGPVVVQLGGDTLDVTAPHSAESPGTVREDRIAEAARLISQAKRPLVFAGQGSVDAADALRALVASLPAPIFSTTSGRGVVPENDPLSLPFDSPGAPVAVINELAASCDLVLAIGVKFSANSTFGAALRLPPNRLVHVDASAEVLERGASAAVKIESDAGRFLDDLSAALTSGGSSTWTATEVAEWRERLAASAAISREPRLDGSTPAEVFAALRRAISDATVVTTDSGIHQYLVRRHLPVLAPRTLLVPSNFQSMGFGLSAAIGAAAGTGGRAIAVIGDGGFALGGLELATAVHHDVPLTVIVLNDGAFGLIRREQLRRTGHESGVALPAVEIDLVARAVGARHTRLDPGALDASLEAALDSSGVTVIEVAMDDREGIRHDRRHGLAATTTRSLLGSGTVERIARSVRQRRS